MVRVTTPSGVVVDEPLVKVFDTAALDWEEETGEDGRPLGTLRKVLSRDDDGDPAICVRWHLPESFAAGEELRHDVRSFTYCLSGELTYTECEPDQEVLLTEGCFIDRRPGSRYRFGAAASPTGLMALEWRMAGAQPLLPIGAADTMTFGVPYDGRTTTQYPAQAPEPVPDVSPAPAPGSVLVDRAGATVLSTRAMRWQPHPTIGGHYLKVLARNDAGEPELVLWFFPPGVAAPTLPFRGYHTYREWAYILDGELRHWEYDDPSDGGALITFRQGLFLDRLAESLHGVEDEISSRTGCTILFMRALALGLVGDSAWRERHTERLG